MNEQFLSNAIAEDASQMIKAYMMQNAQLKAIAEQQKQQIQQLQAENSKLKEVNKQQVNEDKTETKKDAE